MRSDKATWRAKGSLGWGAGAQCVLLEHFLCALWNLWTQLFKVRACLFCLSAEQIYLLLIILFATPTLIDLVNIDLSKQEHGPDWVISYNFTWHYLGLSKRKHTKNGGVVPKSTCMHIYVSLCLLHSSCFLYLHRLAPYPTSTRSLIVWEWASCFLRSEWVIFQVEYY